MLKKLVIVCAVTASSCSFAHTVICKHVQSRAGLGIPKISLDTDTKVFKQYDMMGTISTGRYKETEQFSDYVYILNAKVHLNDTVYNEFRIEPTTDKSQYNISMATFNKSKTNEFYLISAKSPALYQCKQG